MKVVGVGKKVIEIVIDKAFGSNTQTKAADCK